MRGLREDKNTDQAQLEALTRLEAKIDSKLAVLSKHDVDTQDNLFHHTHEPVKAPAEVPAVPGAGVDNSIK
jgi:hypothetical protein